MQKPASRSLAILGSTGSIGQQTLEVVRANASRFDVRVLVAGGANLELLLAQCQEFRPAIVAVQDGAAESIRDQLPEGTTLTLGEEAVAQAACDPQVHTVVAAIVGFAGLRPTLEAIKAGKHIALANKECLVAAGSLVKNALAQSKSMLVPVDSEHSSLFQCMLGRKDRPRRMTITASGGPFLHRSAAEVYEAKPEEATKHPCWDMGAKISVDSAHLMNKGLEIIEAAVLFDFKASELEVLVHPQTIVHGLVEYGDGAVLAALYPADMKVPIAFALSYLDAEEPKKVPGELLVSSGASFLDLASSADLQFFAPDFQRFPALRLAYQALEQGEPWPAILNAANERAVELYLQGNIAFGQIPELVEAVLNAGESWDVPQSLQELFALDARARELASASVDTVKSRGR